MSFLNNIIHEICPDGVDFKKLWELTIWDKKFNGIEKYKQPKTINYNHQLAKNLKKLIVKEGDIKILFTGKGDSGYTDEEAAKEIINSGEIVAIPWGGTAWIQYYNGRFVTGDNRIATSRDTNILDNKFLYYVLTNRIREISSFYRGSGIKHPSMRKVLEMNIPVPSILFQKEIVEILDKFTTLEAELEAELEARDTQYKWYRTYLLSFENVKRSNQSSNIESKNTVVNNIINNIFSKHDVKDIEYYELQDIFNIKNGYTPSKSNDSYWRNGTIPWFRMEDIRENGNILSDSIQHITPEAVKGKLFPANSVIVATSATIGEHALVTVDFVSNQRFTCLSRKEEFIGRLDSLFVHYYCYILDKWCLNNINISSFSSVDMTLFRKFKIPVPPLPIQKEIVRILNIFDTLCTDIAKGIPAEIKARRKQYEYYRNKLLTFKELKA